jgi:glycosyltransferase involved in cell wall biosynthesis
MTKSSNIHVLHIASGDLWAGAEVQLFTLVKTLDKHPETRMSIIILNHGMLEQKLEQIGIEVIVLDESKLNGFQILCQLIVRVRNLKPDVIHTHRNKENILGSIAAQFSGNPPTLRTAHGAPEHRPSWNQVPKRIVLFLDWFCGCFLQKNIIAVSDDLARILANDYPPEKIHAIQNGIDSEHVKKSAAELPKVVKTKSAKFKIGIIGRLVPVKRVDVFIRTAHKLLDEHPELNLSFHVFGGGPMHDELETLNQQFKNHAEIHFEGHSNNIPSELGQLDALLMTSDHEGLPMTLLEAMVLKTPVIAHAVGGIPALLDNGACGTLVNNHNPEGYAQAIIKLTSKPSLRKIIADNAYIRVIEHYSAEQNANAYIQQYHDLVPGK